MRSRLSLACLAVLAGGLLISGCGPGAEKTAEAPSAPQPPLHTVMTTVIAPEAQTLWDVPNKGLDDNGDVDASKLTTDDWAALLASGQKVRDASDQLARMQNIKVAEAGVVLAQESNPGAAKAPDVQRYIDADPAGFSTHFANLTQTASKFVAAAQAKDGKLLGAASTELDAVCEACHLKFWYPEQAAAAQSTN